MPTRQNVLVRHRSPARHQFGAQLCLSLDSEEDWRVFVKKHGCRVRAMVRGAIKSYGWSQWCETDDLVQDLYCRLLSTRSSRPWPKGDASRYLRKVARSVVVDHRRSLLARKRRFEGLSARLTADLSKSDAVDQRWPLTPYEELRRREGWRFIQRHGRRMVQRGELGKPDLEVLWTILVEGRTSREVSIAVEGRLQPVDVDRLVTRFRRSLLRRGIRIPRR